VVDKTNKDIWIYCHLVILEYEHLILQIEGKDRTHFFTVIEGVADSSL